MFASVLLLSTQPNSTLAHSTIERHNMEEPLARKTPMLFEQRATIHFCATLRFVVGVVLFDCVYMLKFLCVWKSRNNPSTEQSKNTHAYTQHRAHTKQREFDYSVCLLWLCFYRSISCQRCCSCFSLTLSLVLPFSSFFCPVLPHTRFFSRFSSICLLFCFNSVQFFHFAYCIFTFFSSLFICLFVCLLVCSLLFALSSTIDFVRARTNSQQRGCLFFLLVSTSDCESIFTNNYIPVSVNHQTKNHVSQWKNKAHRSYISSVQTQRMLRKAVRGWTSREAEEERARIKKHRLGK